MDIFEPAERDERDELAAIGRSLRSVRRQRGLTLRDVERESEGLWKAVVVGSYERGDRALTLKRASGLAAFYHVPLDQLLGLHNPPRDEKQHLIFNLREIRRSGSGLPEPLLRYFQEICRLRSDWNGEVLSLRTLDLIAIAVILDCDESAIYTWANQRNLLILQ
jgi:transcriptional regulator with XRE-family HTH domain